jgi:hypothetical protein
MIKLCAILLGEMNSHKRASHKAFQDFKLKVVMISSINSKIAEVEILANYHILKVGPKSFLIDLIRKVKRMRKYCKQLFS